MPVEQMHANPTLGLREQLTELSKTDYRDLIEGRTPEWMMWEKNGGYLKYDKEGNLLINNVPVADLAAMLSFPGSFEIVDTTNVSLRAEQWVELVDSVINHVDYSGGYENFYATKANAGVDVVTAAIDAGVNIETSSEVDLASIEWLLDNGFPVPDRVVCNGLKLKPEKVFNRQPRLNIPGLVVDDMDRKMAKISSPSYAEMVIRLANMGIDITPIMDDVSEFEIFSGKKLPKMEVGVRYKAYGMAKHHGPVETLKSRHGMLEPQIQQLADKIKNSENLELTTFHAMIGAGETIPVDDLVDSLLECADVYFRLKQGNPTLKYFNMGGGMAPMGFGYNHEEFLVKLFTGLKQKAVDYGVEEPVVQFEFGSFYAVESHHNVFKVLLEKENGYDEDGNPHAVAITALSMMKAIPDFLILQSDGFLFLAGNNANNSCRLWEIGALTCDSDDTWPSDLMRPYMLIAPDSKGKEQWFVVIGTGAYGEQITGGDKSFSGHSGQKNTAEAIFYWGDDGLLHLHVEPRPTNDQAIKGLGFSKENSHRVVGSKKKK